MRHQYLFPPMRKSDILMIYCLKKSGHPCDEFGNKSSESFFKISDNIEELTMDAYRCIQRNQLIEIVFFDANHDCISVIDSVDTR